MWRLNKFFLSEKSHVSLRLAVHLPNQQQVVFQSGQEVAAVARAFMRHTTLTAWFLLNEHDVEAHNYNYADIPQYYVFDKSQTLWKRRQRGGQQIIGRMPVVNLQDSERYYLRMLLLRRSGVVSYDDLKTVNGIVLSSIQQTCTKLGFLEGDHHWHNTMTEASQVKMPSTGKTFVYSTLIHIIRGEGDQVAYVASTGIAVTLLDGSRTAHSVFKIPLVLDATSTCNVKPNSPEAKLLKETKIIIWDESPMTNIHAFLAVNRLLRDILDCSKPFGGKVILLDGDFRQGLPVVPRGSRSLTVACCFKKHPLWLNFHILYLTKNMRALESEKEFSKWLFEVGDGLSGNTIKLPSVCYPKNKILLSSSIMI
ncbi:hypothetical protein AVEN_60834-1 [Araneus ventricosus]|uniref:ATP-dependent DNA helicase n=1 Tax=Araneus ventricosus TaxID=182803 RepID=A0A4Y2VCP8_ARAVE|nr:hypothetical protein AVEN_60834-1 [Araneus ventricosus]